jgi:hypothetical protein
MQESVMGVVKCSSQTGGVAVDPDRQVIALDLLL